MSTTGRALTLTTALLVVTVAASPAVAGDGRTDILPDPTATTVITEPGSYVVVGTVTMTDGSIDCIEIAADDVTIDLNGHTLVGAGGTGVGISQSSASHSRVLNGTVRGFGGGGVVLGDYARVEGLEVHDTGPVAIEVGSFCMVKDNHLSGATEAHIRVLGAQGMIVGNMVATYMGTAMSIYLDNPGNPGSVIADNIVKKNSFGAFRSSDHISIYVAGNRDSFMENTWFGGINNTNPWNGRRRGNSETTHEPQVNVRF